MLSKAADVAEHLRDEMERIRGEVLELNESYRERRAALVEELGPEYVHGGLSLSFVVTQQSHGRFPKATLYWVRGSWRQNTLRAKQARGSNAGRTRKIHHCGENGNYSRTNVTAALTHQHPREVDLTYAYEREAQRLREYLNGMSAIYRALAWCPPMPTIPPGGPKL